MGLKLDWVNYATAKYTVEHWHYSEKIPTSKMAKLGVWEDEIFKGVIIFGVGACNSLVKPYGLRNYEGCELVRIALKEHKTTVSKIIRIAIGIIKKRYPKLKMIVSFADMNQNHHGGIYQASNWIYTGSTPKNKIPIVNGIERHPRVISLMIHDGRAKSRKDFNWIDKLGKHRYLYPLTKELRTKCLKLAKKYPNRV